MALDENSKRTRVEPVFGWLRDHGGAYWPERLLALADGLSVALDPGGVIALDFEAEKRVPPSPRRLAWMIRNAERLAPSDGRQWRQYARRVLENPRAAEDLEKLEHGDARGIDRKLVLEGDTAADCLIECERVVIWVEGKRNDWLAYSTKWDVTRDQVARNAEAASLYAREREKDSCLIVCHEQRLKHHEELLIDGYRRGTWTGGWPHLSAEEREQLGSRLGTIKWADLAAEWPGLAERLT